MRVKLDKVCKRIYAGGDVPKDRYSTVKTAEYAIPIYANAEKDNGLYGYTDTARENELSITVAARGTIGFTAIRREPFLPVVRLITVVPDLSTVSERYLYYALRNCKPASSGTSIPQLTVPDIKKNEIELYSLSVQETIADKLDAVGRVIELRQQQLQTLDELVKARFVEMFGDLVQGDRISTNRRKIGEIASVTKLAGFEFTKYIHYKDKGEKDDVIMLRGMNCKNGHLILDDIKWIDKGTSDILPRSKLYAGDILMTYAGTIGDVALVDADDKYHLAPNVGKITLVDKKKYNPVFVIHLFMYSHDYIMTFASQVAQASINMEKIRNFEFFFPETEQQNRFAAFVAEVDKSKVAIQKALDEAQLLFDSLMQKYFG